MRTPLAFAALAAVLVLGAPQAKAGFAAGADAIDRAAPRLTEEAWHRGRPHRSRVVCATRYRQFYNGLFWQTAPIRTCWRR